MKRKVLVVAAIAVRAAIARILQPAGYSVELCSGMPRTRELLASGTFVAAIVG